MKKLLVVGMTAVLALGVFAGCGQQEQAPVQEQQPTQVETQVQNDGAAPEQQNKIVEDGVVMDPSEYDLISEEKAKKIALGKVDGATEGDIYKFDLDYDDGIWVYEGEIQLGEWEYEFEINAENGDVMSLEKDHIYD